MTERKTRVLKRDMVCKRGHTLARAGERIPRGKLHCTRCLLLWAPGAVPGYDPVIAVARLERLERYVEETGDLTGYPSDDWEPAP